MGIRKIMMRVTDSGLAPYDGFASSMFKAKGYRAGQLVGVTTSRIRSPGFNRLAHKIGQLCSDNIEDFRGMDAHSCLKRLQLETCVCCEPVKLHDGEIAWLPESLAFDSLGEEDFRRAVRTMCQWIAETYWPDLSADKIASMAEFMVD